MEVRVVNDEEDSYFIPTLEDFKRGNIKEYFIAHTWGTLNTDIDIITLSSKSGHLRWGSPIMHKQKEYNAIFPLLNYFIRIGRLRVKKENNMTKSKVDQFKLTPVIRKEQPDAPVGLIKESVLEAQDIVIQGGIGTTEEIKIKALEILKEKLKEKGIKKSNISIDTNVEFKGVCATGDINKEGRGILLKVKTTTKEASVTKTLTDFFDTVAERANEKGITSIFDLMYESYSDKSKSTIQEELEGLIGLLGENVVIEELQYIEPIISLPQINTEFYLHLGKTGAIVTYLCDGEIFPQSKEVIELIRKILAHIVYARPLCVKEEELLNSIITKEREFIINEISEDKTDNQKLEITKGKLSKFKKEVILELNEASFESKKTIGQILKENKLTIVDFIYI